MFATTHVAANRFVLLVWRAQVRRLDRLQSRRVNAFWPAPAVNALRVSASLRPCVELHWLFKQPLREQARRQ